MCNFVPRLEHEFGFIIFQKYWTLFDLEEVFYFAIELLVHSSPKIKATVVSFSQTKLLVHFYFLHKFSRFDMFLVNIQIDLVENDADQNSFVLLTYLYGWKITENYKSFCTTGKLVPFFHDTAFWVKTGFRFLFFLQCIISSLHYVTKFTRRDA